LSREGKEGVDKHFHIQMHADRMMAVYQKAVGKEVPDPVFK
jgi:hypothetical protein